MTNPPKPLDHLGQHAQKNLAVSVVQVDILLCIATGGDMVERMREFEAEGASREGRIGFEIMMSRLDRLVRLQQGEDSSRAIDAAVDTFQRLIFVAEEVFVTDDIMQAGSLHDIQHLFFHATKYSGNTTLAQLFNQLTNVLFARSIELIDAITE